MTQAETYISTPNSSNDYTYTYDALGNVQVVYKASGSIGQEAYFFTQDAFGNELSGDANIPASNCTNLLGGATWASARTAGITEHQMGKIQSAFSGLYYFHSRWYDPFVGRFVGRDGGFLNGSMVYTGARSNSGCCTSGGANGLIVPQQFGLGSYIIDGNMPTMSGIKEWFTDPGVLCRDKCDDDPCKDKCGKVLSEGRDEKTHFGTLSDLPEMGKCNYAVDGLYTSGGILKIPNDCICTIKCDGKVNCTCEKHNIWSGDIPELKPCPDKDGKCWKYDPGWPDNPCTSQKEEDITPWGK